MAKRRIVRPLDIEEVEHIAFRLAQEHLTFDEPIPDFSTRFPNILEGCLETPFQKFFGKTAYPTLLDKACMLFYLIIKNHPFQNGNKRIALTSLIVFLYKNDRWLKVDNRLIYELTIWVAESQSKYKNFIVMAIHEFIRKYAKALQSTPLF